MVELVYKNSRMWSFFKPLVDFPYEFKGVTDEDIIKFLDKDLPKYYDPSS